MKLKRYHLYLLILAGTAAIVGGVSAANSETQKTDPLQIARGAKAWAQACGGCHNLRAPDELRDEQWEVVVTHMRVRANLPGEVARDIAAFLKASN